MLSEAFSVVWCPDCQKLPARVLEGFRALQRRKLKNATVTNKKNGFIT
jgi:hypothetical protein